MSKAIKISAEKRDASKNPRQLRADGLLPATIYGKGMESVSIQLDAKTFLYDYAKNTDATFEIKLDKDSFNAVVANLEKNYSTNQYMNAEFKVV